MRVGNDIIDLGDPFNRRKTGDPRFLDRILNREERTRAALVPDPAAPWLWWAAKEAAFKVLQADAPSLTFQPRRFSVTLFPGRTEGLRQRKGAGMPYLLQCRVESPAGAVPVRIFRYGGFVHALAALLPAGTGERLIWGIARQDRRGRGDGLVSESAAARQALKQGLSRRFGWDVSDVAISPSVAGRGGPPRVFLRGRSQPLPVSISHDGRFVAYAFLAGEGVGSPAGLDEGSGPASPLSAAPRRRGLPDPFCTDVRGGGLPRFRHVPPSGNAVSGPCPDPRGRKGTADPAGGPPDAARGKGLGRRARTETMRRHVPEAVPKGGGRSEEAGFPCNPKI